MSESAEPTEPPEPVRTWTVPPNPIAKQAEAAGEAVPVGSTANELRARGYDIPSDVPGIALLAADADSPTGYMWTPPIGFTAGSLRRAGYIVHAEIPDEAALYRDEHGFTWTRVEWYIVSEKVPEDGFATTRSTEAVKEVRRVRGHDRTGLTFAMRISEDESKTETRITEGEPEPEPPT